MNALEGEKKNPTRLSASGGDDDATGASELKHFCIFHAMYLFIVVPVCIFFFHLAAAEGELLTSNKTETQNQ